MAVGVRISITEAVVAEGVDVWGMEGDGPNTFSTTHNPNKFSFSYSPHRVFISLGHRYCFKIIKHWGKVWGDLGRQLLRAKPQEEGQSRIDPWISELAWGYHLYLLALLNPSTRFCTLGIYFCSLSIYQSINQSTESQFSLSLSLSLSLSISSLVTFISRSFEDPKKNSTSSR